MMLGRNRHDIFFADLYIAEKPYELFWVFSAAQWRIPSLFFRLQYVVARPRLGSGRVRWEYFSIVDIKLFFLYSSICLVRPNTEPSISLVPYAGVQYSSYYQIALVYDGIIDNVDVSTKGLWKLNFA